MCWNPLAGEARVDHLLDSIAIALQRGYGTRLKVGWPWQAFIAERPAELALESRARFVCWNPAGQVGYGIERRLHARGQILDYGILCWGAVRRPQAASFGLPIRCIQE